MISQILSGGKVGVSPSTTTMYVPYQSTPELRAGLGVVTEQDAWTTGRRAQGLPGTTAIRLSGDNLGLVTRTANRTLGDTPTDAQLAKIYGYMPVRTGWIHGNDIVTGKKFYSEAGAAAGVGLGNPVVGMIAGDPPADTSSPVTQNYLEEALKLQRRQVLFQGIATAAMLGLAISAVVGFFCHKR